MGIYGAFQLVMGDPQNLDGLVMGESSKMSRYVKFQQFLRSKKSFDSSVRSPPQAAAASSGPWEHGLMTSDSRWPSLRIGGFPSHGGYPRVLMYRWILQKQNEYKPSILGEPYFRKPPIMIGEKWL